MLVVRACTVRHAASLKQRQGALAQAKRLAGGASMFRGSLKSNCPTGPVARSARWRTLPTHSTCSRRPCPRGSACTPARSASPSCSSTGRICSAASASIRGFRARRRSIRYSADACFTRSRRGASTSSLRPATRSSWTEWVRRASRSVRSLRNRSNLNTPSARILRTAVASGCVEAGNLPCLARRRFLVWNARSVGCRAPVPMLPLQYVFR
jgi:hypothetical protein